MMSEVNLEPSIPSAMRFFSSDRYKPEDSIGVILDLFNPTGQTYPLSIIEKPPKTMRIFSLSDNGVFENGQID